MTGIPLPGPPGVTFEKEDGYVDPLTTNGRRVALLYQLAQDLTTTNDPYTCLDLSDCNLEISHTVNNECVQVNNPYAGILVADVGLMTDDVMTLSFDIPIHAIQIYKSMYAFVKSGLLAKIADENGVTSTATLAEAYLGDLDRPFAQQKTTNRYYWFILGETIEERMNVVSSGPNQQMGLFGVYIFPKSCTWELTSGKCDFMTVRLTGLVATNPSQDINSVSNNSLNWMTMTLKILGGVYPILAPLSFVAGTQTMEDMINFIEGKTNKVGDTVTPP